MEEKKYPIKWEYKSHSYQIGDTGDYDGYWEVTNGRDSLITNDDYEDIEKDLQAVVDLLNNTYANFKVDRTIEAALEHEKEWLKHELEESRKAARCPVWVKASEFKTSVPVYRPYRRKRNNDNEEPYDYGEIYVTEDNGDIFFDVNNERSFEPQTYERWKDYEILDESGTAAAGREEVETIDIETAKRHAVAFANWLLPPGPICTEKDYELFMMKPESLLTQPRADLIREANNRDLDGVGSEAVEFAEWVRENFESKKHTGWKKHGTEKPYYSTVQLYELFKQQKEK